MTSWTLAERSTAAQVHAKHPTASKLYNFPSSQTSACLYLPSVKIASPIHTREKPPTDTHLARILHLDHAHPPHPPRFVSHTHTTMTTSQPPVPDPNAPSTSYTDPTFSLLNSTCLDLLLIELVPMAYRITADLASREEEFLRPSSSRKQNNRLSGTSNDANSGTGAGGPVGGGGGATATVDDEEAREAVFHRLEGLGYRVGLGIVER